MNRKKKDQYRKPKTSTNKFWITRGSSGLIDIETESDIQTVWQRIKTTITNVNEKLFRYKPKLNCLKAKQKPHSKC